MRRLSAVPFARRYLIGQSLSTLGDVSLWLALAIWVRELTGSNAEAGLTFFFMAAASLTGPLWGTMVDRYRRRPILIGVNLFGALMTLALLGVHSRQQVWVIWLVMTGYGVTNSILSAAQNGFLHTLVPDELLGDAQGLLSTVREGLRLISPLIGAGLFTLVGGHVIAVVDAVGFLIAAGTVVSIRVDEPEPVRDARRLRTEVAAGLTHIRATVELRQVTIALVLACLVIGFTETAIIAVVTSGLHLSASWLGPLEAVMGVGAIAGGPTVAPAMRRLGEGRVTAIGLLVLAVGESLTTVTTIGTACVGVALTGFGLPWLIAASMTLIQRRTPASLQGRVGATVDVLTGVPQAISIALGAGLVAIVGFQVLLGTVGLVIGITAVWLLTRPEQGRPVTVPARIATVDRDVVDPLPVGASRA